MLLFISGRSLICCSADQFQHHYKMLLFWLNPPDWWQKKSWNRKERQPNLTCGFLLSAMSLELDFGASYLWDNSAHQRERTRGPRPEESAFVCEMTWLYGRQHLSNTLKIKEVVQAACKASGQVHYRVHLYYTTTPLSNKHKYRPLQFSVWYRYLLFLLAYCKK